MDYLPDHLVAKTEELINENERNIVKISTLYWNIIYSIVLKYQKIYNENWLFIKIENFMSDPLHTLKNIHQYSNLEFSEKFFAKNNLINSDWIKNSSSNNLCLTNIEIYQILSETRSVAKQLGY